LFSAAADRNYLKSIGHGRPHALGRSLQEFYMAAINSISRRAMVGGVGAVGSGLTLAAATQAMAQGESDMNTSQPMSNPISKYPKPPFQGQEQPWPGLASKMEPRPDHGETSYKGSGRLTGRKALITGGDSGMGRGAAIAFAREGADVAINYFPTEEPDAREVIELIQKAGRKAVALPGDLRDRSFCQKLVEDAVNQLGGLDILVLNAGRQQSIPNVENVSDEEFDWTMKTNIYAPFDQSRLAAFEAGRNDHRHDVRASLSPLA
jgi:hypothetical protein